MSGGPAVQLNKSLLMFGLDIRPRVKEQNRTTLRKSQSVCELHVLAPFGIQLLDAIRHGATGIKKKGGMKKKKRNSLLSHFDVTKQGCNRRSRAGKHMMMTCHLSTQWHLERSSNNPVMSTCALIIWFHSFRDVCVCL